MAKNKDRHIPKSPTWETVNVSGHIGFRCKDCGKVFGPATMGTHKH